MRYLIGALLAAALLVGASAGGVAPAPAAPLAQATATPTLTPTVTPTPRVVGTGYTRTDMPDNVRCYEYHENGQVSISCLVVGP